MASDERPPGEEPLATSDAASGAGETVPESKNVLEDDAAGGSEYVAPPPASPRRRLTRLIFLLFGALVAVYLGRQGPQEQHVRVVLGSGAPEVTGVDLQYVGNDGDVAREAHFVFPKGGAPRVVSHEPKLPNGEYRLQIDIDARDGRRAVQRQVTLGGGSTQVDVSNVLGPSRPESP